MFSNSGRGKNQKNLGLGASGNCTCSNCGYSTPHRRNIPCYEMTCPNCASVLNREEISTGNSKPQIDQATCIGCSRCVSVCPVGAISMIGNKATIDQNACIGCRKCISVCPVGAIR